MSIAFGDNVRILSSPETDERGLSGRIGQVYGETIPSVTAVDVISQVENDFALNVSIEGIGTDYWLSLELLELVDHAEGTEIVIGNYRAVRRADGSWDESGIKGGKKWWQFWK